MAQKLVDLLSPVMDELAYIFAPYSEKTSIAYNVETRGSLNILSTFSVTFLTELSRRERSRIIQNLAKHMTRTATCIKQMTISYYSINITLQDGFVSSAIQEMTETNVIPPFHSQPSQNAVS